MACDVTHGIRTASQEQVIDRAQGRKTVNPANRTAVREADEGRAPSDDGDARQNRSLRFTKRSSRAPADPVPGLDWQCQQY